MAEESQIFCGSAPQQMSARHRQVNFGKLSKLIDGNLNCHFEGKAVPKIGGIGSGVAV